MGASSRTPLPNCNLTQRPKKTYLILLFVFRSIGAINNIATSNTVQDENLPLGITLIFYRTRTFTVTFPVSFSALTT